MSDKNKKILIIGIIIFAIILILTAIFFLFPKISLKGNKVVDITYPSKYEEQGYKIDGIIKGLEKNVKIKSNVNDKKIGTYKVEYTLSFLVFKIKKIRTVNILDKTKPEITLEGDMKLSMCPNKEYEEQGYKAIDDYDGDITLSVKTKKLDDGILYEVVDSSNNKTEAKRTIEYIDSESPSITLNGNSTQNVVIGNTYNEQGAKANDNCDGDISDRIKIEGSVDTGTIGSYEIKYTVSDVAGNSSTVSRTVKVVNKTNYSNSTIYLTFDDGPSANVTPKILDILKEEGVKATFFVIDRGEGLDYLIKRAYDEGHTIALHTASHNYQKIYSSEDAFFNDLNSIREKVKNITGEYSNIIRFPGGTSNTVSRNYNRGIMSRLSKQVLEKGFVYFDWNVSSGDAGGVYSNWDVYNNVVNGLSNRSTNVVLMHDSGAHNYTLNALRDIIRYGKEKGFNFDRITVDTPAVRHNPQN